MTIGDDGYFWSVSTKGLLQCFKNKVIEIKTILEKPEQEFICISSINKSSILVGSNHDLYYFDVIDKSLTSLKLNIFIDQIILDK